MWPELLTPREGLIDYRVFYADRRTTSSTSHQYTRPAGARMAFIWRVDAAGGGGGGRSRTAGSAGGGGGGGPGGSIARIITPWDLIPDTLFINVGRGGTGGSVNSNGGAGVRSWITGISYDGAGSVSSSVGILGLNGASIGFGSAGTTGGGGAGGASHAALGATSGAWHGVGAFVSIASQGGGAGGSHLGGAGTDITWGTSGTNT